MIMVSLLHKTKVQLKLNANNKDTMYISEWGITCSSPTQTNQSLKFVSICIKFMGCRRLLDKEIIKKSKIWKYVESGTHELL